MNKVAHHFNTHLWAAWRSKFFSSRINWFVLFSRLRWFLVTGRKGEHIESKTLETWGQP